MKKVAKTFRLKGPFDAGLLSPGLLDVFHPLVAVSLFLCAQLQRFLSIVAKNDQEVVLNQGERVEESEWRKLEDGSSLKIMIT